MSKGDARAKGKHERRKLEDVYIEAAGEALASQRYDCPVCGDRFATLGSKKHHVKDEHPRH